MDTISPEWLKMMGRLLVVPESSERIYFSIGVGFIDLITKKRFYHKVSNLQTFFGLTIINQNMNIENII